MSTSEGATPVTVISQITNDSTCAGVSQEEPDIADISSNQAATDCEALTSKVQDIAQDASTSSDFAIPKLVSEIRPKTSSKGRKPTELESEELNPRVVDIFTEDSGPKWYNAEGCNITKPIVPTKLPEAFNLLPIFGRPNCRSDLPEYQERMLQEFVGLDGEEFAKLAEWCSPDHARTGSELKMPTNVPNQGPWSISYDDLNDEDKDDEDKVPDNKATCVAKKFKMRSERDGNNSYSKRLKYRGIRVMPLTEEDGPMVTLGLPLQPGKDLIFRIRIYRPFPRVLKRDKGGPGRHSVFSRDIVLLGRQRLCDLRDRVVCPNDVDMRLDVSRRLDHPPPATAKELFPSGFLFINNVFYVDNRAGCHDTSARLRQWAASRRGLGAFPARDLSQRLDQLTVRLGHPEVYVHQGNCEHLFTFSEIRVLTANDPLKISQYPAHTLISQNQTVYCTTCAEFSAKWVVTECQRVPFDPAYFCDSCFRLYMYKDGEKIGHFKAHLYRGNEINMLKPQY